MRRFSRKLFVAFLTILSLVIPQTQAFAATAAPVVNVSLVGQDGQAGTIFGWLDQSYTSNVNATITSRTISFWGNQAWTGYDRSGNKITGSTTPKSFTLTTAPVQMITPGTYSYQVTETDSTGTSATSGIQSFTVGDPPAQTSVSKIPAGTGIDGNPASIGFSVSAAGARSVSQNGGSIIINENGPFVVYDGSSTNVSTENWSMTGSNSWTGTTSGGSSITSTGTWNYSRNTGTHWVPPYTYQVQTGGGYYQRVVTSATPMCTGQGGEHPPLTYTHTGSCYVSSSTAWTSYTYSNVWVRPTYATYSGGNYWAYVAWPSPDPNLIQSISTVGSYNFSLSNGTATYGVNLTVDPFRGGIADFTLNSSVIGTTQKLSGLGVTPTGNLSGTTETWYLYSSQGTQTFSSLSALNNASYTVTADLGVTIGHKVVINNQTYMSYQTFIVKHAAFVNTSNGGVVHVTQILYPASGQASPTDTLPVQVKAGGEVTYQIQTIGNVGSVVVTYSDGQTQSLIQGSPGVWGGFYYPSSTQTIPVTTPNGTAITTKITATTTDGVVLNASSALLVINGTNSSLGGTKYPAHLIE